jgi:hypothetical protein
MKVAVFCGLELCGLQDIRQCFGGTAAAIFRV